MRMQLITATEIYVNLYVFGDILLPFDKRRKIKKVAELFNKEREFFNEEMQKLIEAYVEKDTEGLPVVENGEFVFENIKAKEEYIKKVVELRKTEIEIDIEKIRISIAEQAQLKMSIRQEDLLSNIFVFEE